MISSSNPCSKLSFPFVWSRLGAGFSPRSVQCRSRAAERHRPSRHLVLRGTRSAPQAGGPWDTSPLGGPQQHSQKPRGEPIKHQGMGKAGLITPTTRTTPMLHPNAKNLLWFPAFGLGRKHSYLFIYVPPSLLSRLCSWIFIHCLQLFKWSEIKMFSTALSFQRFYFLSFFEMKLRSKSFRL